MKLKINNKNFGDIRTAVFYRNHKYIPTGDIEESDIAKLILQCTSDKIQYQGSKSKISNMDFAEYNFSYLIEKYKFNDNFLISYLDDQSKELVGKNIDDLEKVESTLFPTLRQTNGTSKYNYDYFGSALIANQSFLLFETPGRENNLEGYYKIELYEDVLDFNNSSKCFIEHELLEKLGDKFTDINIPAITITLGPENIVKNNPENLYYPYDPILTSRKDELSIVDYIKLREEINCSKVVYLYLSKNNEILELNLAYKSWIDSNNPNRNANKYTIRNDEYFSSRNNIDILENLEDSDFWFDGNSGTLVGNSEYNHLNCPLLRRKLSKIKNESYSPYVRYNKGDVVKYGANPLGDPYFWESLTDNNYHNDPFTNSNWIEHTKINNFFTRRINILIYPLGAGYSIPGGSITVNSENESVEFEIQSNVGYNIYYRSTDLSDNMNDHQDSCYLVGPDKENSVKLSSDYWIYSKKDVGDRNIETITVKNWSPFFKELDENGSYKYNDLIFNFGIAKSFISFYATDEIITESYKNWKDYFREPSFSINNIVTISSEGIENFPNSSDIESTNKLSVDPGSKIVMIIPELTSHSIDYIKSTYKVGSTTRERFIYPRILNDKSFEFTDMIDFSESTYLFHLVAKILIITAAKFEGYTVNEVIGRVKYNEDYSFKFYNNNGTADFERLIITEETTGNEVVYYLDRIGKEFELSGAVFNLTLEDDFIYSLSIKEAKSNYKITLE